MNADFINHAPFRIAAAAMQAGVYAPKQITEDQIHKYLQMARLNLVQDNPDDIWSITEDRQNQALYGMIQTLIWSACLDDFEYRQSISTTRYISNSGEKAKHFRAYVTYIAKKYQQVQELIALIQLTEAYLWLLELSKFAENLYQMYGKEESLEIFQKIAVLLETNTFSIKSIARMEQALLKIQQKVKMDHPTGRRLKRRDEPITPLKEKLERPITCLTVPRERNLKRQKKPQELMVGSLFDAL